MGSEGHTPLTSISHCGKCVGQASPEIALCATICEDGGGGGCPQINEVEVGKGWVWGRGEGGTSPPGVTIIYSDDSLGTYATLS